ncbi:MAG: hypothetical protein DWQ34_01720 [Planctomycetota bacterium]|nr:MAG: hypothetical protein DWQ34_01720 [Planctomycetota bacterium]
MDINGGSRAAFVLRAVRIFAWCANFACSKLLVMDIRLAERVGYIACGRAESVETQSQQRY